jgi:hypothetical protein
MSVLDDLEEICRLVGGERPQGKVVEDEDEDIDPGQRQQETGRAAVEAGQGQVEEQPWHPLVEGGATGADRRLSHRAGEEGLATASRPPDQDVVMPGHPLGGGEAQDLGAVQPAGVAEVDVLDGAGAPRARWSRP